MISSMTGFACGTQEGAFGILVWEFRSVNHRFLELAVRLPERLRSQEGVMRERIQNKIKRGKVEAGLKWIMGGLTQEGVLQESVLEQLQMTLQKVQHYFPKSRVNALDILSWPGVFATPYSSSNAVEKAALDLLDVTLQDLLEARHREGNGIKVFLQQRLLTIQDCLHKIRGVLPALKAQSMEKLKQRFSELKAEVNSERLEQELVWLLQKTDVAEEIQRLESHLHEVERILRDEAVVGRRLDFLIQELNREANTLGSKCVDAEVVQSVVEMKVQIEQMREQVQNIE